MAYRNLDDAERYSVKAGAAARRGANDVLTEDSAALEFARLFDGVLVYDHSAGSWFVWDETHWRKESTGLAFEWSRNLVRDLSAEIEKPSTRYAVRKTSFASGVEKFARSSRVFAITSDVWNANPGFSRRPAEP